MCRFGPPVERHPPLSPPSNQSVLPLRGQLRVVMYAWVFGAAWMWAVQGVALNRYARSLGMPDWAFGLLGALPYAGALFQLPASYYLERYGHRRRVFLIDMTISRLSWTALALIPWVMPDMRAWWWPVMLIWVAFASITAFVGVPAWMGWMSDIIPSRVRGRFFARRQRMGFAVGIVISLSIAWIMAIIEQTAGPDGVPSQAITLQLTSITIAIAGLVGTLDILAFRHVRDDQPPTPKGQVNLLSHLAEPLRDRNYLVFLAHTFVYVLSIGFLGQYIWLYILEVVKISYWEANLYILVVPMGLAIVAYAGWGRAIDRLGKQPVMVICSAVVFAGGAGWAITGPGDLFWPGYIIAMTAALAHPGIELARINIVLDQAGTRRGRTGGSAYVALNGIVWAAAGVVSGGFGSLIASTFTDWTYTVSAFNLTLTYHHLLFAASALFRLPLIPLALMLREPRATGTRDAIKYMTGVVYSNMREAVGIPLRAAGRVTRLAYRLNPPRRRRP